MVESVRKSATWTREGPPEDALNAVEAYVKSHFGSQFMYRLMGVNTTRVPYTVRVSVKSIQGTKTKLTAEAFSDAGPYLFRIDSATRQYEQLLSNALRELQRQ